MYSLKSFDGLTFGIAVESSTCDSFSGLNFGWEEPMTFDLTAWAIFLTSESFFGLFTMLAKLYFFIKESASSWST